MANTKEKSTKAIHGPGIDLDFSTAPTTWQFLQSDAFVRGLMGPVGSGKSALAPKHFHGGNHPGRNEREFRLA